MQSRRQFLTHGIRATTALAVFPTTALLGRGLRRVNVGALHHTSFTPHLHSIFFVTSGVKTVPMLLTEATGEKTKSGETFTLRFRSTARAPLGQGTYQFDHGILGTFNLFVVPGATTGNTRHYRAIINRA